MGMTIEAGTSAIDAATAEVEDAVTGVVSALEFPTTSFGNAPAIDTGMGTLEQNWRNRLADYEQLGLATANLLQQVMAALSETDAALAAELRS
ncbi:MAG: hypothetical protein ACI8TP_001027 [Acidimicrobiales bacterium]|jgi:hypothetical protein